MLQEPPQPQDVEDTQQTLSTAHGPECSGPVRRAHCETGGWRCLSLTGCRARIPCEAGSDCVASGFAHSQCFTNAPCDTDQRSWQLLSVYTGESGRTKVGNAWSVLEKKKRF